MILNSVMAVILRFCVILPTSAALGPIT